MQAHIEIPNEVFDGIRNDYDNDHLYTLHEVRHSLRSNLNHIKYFEHANFILSQLNGDKLPTISSETVDALSDMMAQIIIAYKDLFPGHGFFQFSYALHRMLQRLKRDDLLVYVPISPSFSKLPLLDERWNAVCAHLQWTPEPS